MMTYRDFKNIINIIKYYRNSSMSTKISTNIAKKSRNTLNLLNHEREMLYAK